MILVRSGPHLGQERRDFSHPCPPLSLSLQIMLLETARRYNHETECITFLKDFTYSKDDFHRAGMAQQAEGWRQGWCPWWAPAARDLRWSHSC